MKNDFGKVDSKLIFPRKWQPQKVILALKEVCTFVSHGGWGSTTEGIISQTPIICLPCFGDQFYSARLVEQNKIGIQLYDAPTTAAPPLSFEPPVTQHSFISALQAVTEQPSYLENVVRVSRICKSYNSDQIVNDVVAHALEFGNDHLIGTSF